MVPCKECGLEGMHKMDCSRGSLFPFDLGTVVATPWVQYLPTEFQHKCLLRHSIGDWGDGFEPEDREEDWELNDKAAALPDRRILSIYKIDEESTMWIVTEGEGENRVTTLTTPSEY